MVRISAMYPATPGATFDHDYYRDTHVPMVLERLKPFGCDRIEIDRGIAGGAPGEGPVYSAIGHIFVDSLDGFASGMKEHGSEIQGDVPNFSSIKPQVQISEVVA
jgi:uncharacterized protein (TIGR02118 family)